MSTRVEAAAGRATQAAVMARSLLVGLRSLIDQGGTIEDTMFGLPVLEFEGPGEVYVECSGGPCSGEVFIGWTVDGERLLTRRVQVVKAVASVRYLLAQQDTHNRSGAIT